MVAAAVIGAGVVGAGAQAYSGRQAADASRRGSRDATSAELEMYYQTREDYAPYREVGTNALNQLAQLYGLAANDGPLSREAFQSSNLYVPDISFSGTDIDRGANALVNEDLDRQYNAYLEGYEPPSTTPDYSGFYDSPDYNFAYDEGMRAVEQSLAKRGLGGASDSGAAQRELTRFGQGLASQQLNNYKNSLSALAGIGQTSTSQLATLGANTASNIGANTRAAADARASSYLNTGSAIGNVANSYGQVRLLQAGGYI